MSRNYGCYCSVTLSGGANRTIVSQGQRGLRIDFTVFQSTIQTPNAAEIKLFNLDPQTVQQFQKKEFSQVTLDAGFDDNHGVIYRGDIKASSYRKEDNVTDYVTLFCATGDRAYNQSIVKTTLAAGHTPQDRVNAAIKAMAPFGMSLGLVNVDLSKPRYPRGIPLFQLARDTLRDVALTAGATWSMQNDGKVHIVDERKSVPGDVVFNLNSNTGMIGWPEQTENGIIVKSLINPALDIQKKVRINQADIQQADPDYQTITSDVSQRSINLAQTGKISADGTYVVLFIQRSGSMRPSGDWFDTSTVIATDAVPNASQMRMGAPYTQRQS